VASNYFEENLKTHLDTQIFSNESINEAFVENEALYLTAQLDEGNFQLVKIPNNVPRFFVFPKQNGKHYITFVDNILKYNLRQSSQQEEAMVHYAIKISRDAELYIEDEYSGNLKEKIKLSLPRRDAGQATRVLIDPAMPKDFRKILNSALDVTNTDVIEGGTYHNFKDFFGFPNPTSKKLNDP